MNRILFLLLLPVLISCSAKQQQVNPPVAATLDFESITYRNQEFDVVRIDLRQQAVKMILRDEAEQGYNNAANLKADFPDLLFATNGGMYLEDRTPQGLYIEAGETIKSVNKVKEAYGNFYMQPNGIFSLKGNSASIQTTENYLKTVGQVDYATQYGPMLVIDKALHPAFNEGSTSKFVRNGVGLVSEHELVFAISKKTVNFYDFAMLFKEILNCEQALYLDGFISKMYVKETERRDVGGDYGVIIYAH